MLELLESSMIDGRSGLDIWIQTWCENAETFQGLWANRVSSLALCDLLVSNRPSLINLMVKGDIIVKAQTQNGQNHVSYILSLSLIFEVVIMTRSRTKQSTLNLFILFLGTFL